MDVIGVLDLRHGQVVHAVAGHRERYVPARMTSYPDIAAGDAVALARVYVTTLGLAEIYVADLDAIIDRAPQFRLTRAIAESGAVLWVDAGIRSAHEARAMVGNAASRPVVGLETLPDFAALTAICREVDGDTVAFSLDLRNRRPITTSADLAAMQVEDLVAHAADAGAGSVIVLDLARVGTQTGPDLDLLAGVRAAVPRVRLIAGGGVRGPDDLSHLEDVGCDAALVATALLNGQLTADSIRALKS
jgi:phosphoribosylformimino-5-aminoimidazole carboxamide ribotide isomerase